MMGAATEKAPLPRLSFVLGIESCCEVDDQRRWLMYCKRAICKSGHICRPIHKYMYINILTDSETPLNIRIIKVR